MSQSFYSALMNVLIHSMYAGPTPDGGWRFGPPPQDADGKRLFVVPENAVEDLAKFQALEPIFPDFAEVFPLFEDEYSQKVMLLRIACMMLGRERVAITMTSAQYQKYREHTKPFLVKKAVSESGIIGLNLDAYDLHSIGLPIRVLTSIGGLINQFLLQQYRLVRGGVTIDIEPGDTVIEGGMCWGDSAMNFAHKAGKKGRVLGFEFEPFNLQIMTSNFEVNPELAKRITIFTKALFDESGKRMSFPMAGPATGMFLNTDGQEVSMVDVETMTIDDMVEREALQRVDFIKLDIEGAEAQAMRGAEKTLRRFRPKLALSAYHRKDDIPVLIKYLRDLDLGYRFWLDHFKPDINETMLFAKTDSR